jgi:chromosome segregation ATPase
VNAPSGLAGDSAAIVPGVVSSARNVMMEEVNLSVEIDLRRRNGQGINILQENGHELIGQVSNSLMESVEAWHHVDEVSAASVKLVQARKKADAAIKNRGDAVRALVEKAAVVQKLQSEQNAAEQELAEIEKRAASGTKQKSDDDRRNRLEAEIHAKEDAITKANREAQKADEAKEKADKAAQDALDEQEAAQEESKEVEPDLDHLHDVPLGR